LGGGPGIDKDPGFPEYLGEEEEEVKDEDEVGSGQARVDLLGYAMIEAAEDIFVDLIPHNSRPRRASLQFAEAKEISLEALS